MRVQIISEGPKTWQKKILLDSQEIQSAVRGLAYRAGVNDFDAVELDLVIVIPKKHTLLEGIFKKSHTKDFVFHAHLPIMCVHQ